MLKLFSCRGTDLQAVSLVLVGVWGAVAALLTAIGIAALPAADLSTAKRTAFTSFTLPVQPARRAAHFCVVTWCQHTQIKESQNWSENESLLTRLSWILQFK